MTRQEIIKTINAKVAEEFEIEESTITPDAPIFETLDLDSISLVDLIGIVQTVFRVRIEKSDLEHIITFADLYAFIEQHQKE